MLKTAYLSSLVSKARNPELSSNEFKNLINEITDFINDFGVDAFEAFKAHFKEFKSLSWNEVLLGGGDPQVRADETLVAAVLRKVTIRPKATASDKLPEFLFRGCAVNPEKILELDGYHRTIGERSLFQHQESTVRSIFISATSAIAIACEFAMQSDRKGGGGYWVYKIRPDNAVSCNEFFLPYSIYSCENEYVFIERLPASQIVGVAWAKNDAELGTDFYPLAQHFDLLIELVRRGYVTL